MPNYMLFLHTNSERPAPRSPDEMMAVTKAYMGWADRMRAEGRLKGGDKLTNDPGKVMRPRDGRVKAVSGNGAEVVFGGLAVSVAGLLTDEDLSERNVAGKLGSASRFSKAFLSNQFSLVCSVQPARHNSRLASQQGCFLCPGDLSEFNGFESNLLEQLIMGKDPEYFFPVWNPPQIFKFTVPGHLKVSTLRELRRMNISRASLFPGLDGFAKSLKVELDLTPGKVIR